MAKKKITKAQIVKEYEKGAYSPAELAEKLDVPVEVVTDAISK